MSARILAADAPGALDAAVAALAAGQVVGVPTETVYGLAALPADGPLRALVRAKGRDPGKGIAVLADGLDQLTGVVMVPTTAIRLAERFWPGPLTLVLPVRDGVALPDLLTGGRTTLGVRVPDHPVPRALARRLGPLAVSSANRAGEPDALAVPELLVAVGDAAMAAAAEAAAAPDTAAAPTGSPAGRIRGVRSASASTSSAYGCGCGSSARRGAPADTGSAMVMATPFGRRASTQVRPPCRRTSSRATNRPNPLAARSRAMLHGSKIWSTCSGRKAGPLSSTVRRNSWS